MKIFSYIFFIISTLIVGFNVTKLNFNNLLEGDSLISLICIVGVLCAVVILLIFRLSKSIDQKLKNQ
jgi:Mg2+ and Co2+ transporter CorA